MTITNLADRSNVLRQAVALRALAVVGLVAAWFFAAALTANSGVRNPDNVFPGPLATLLAFPEFAQFGTSGEGPFAVLAQNTAISAGRLALGLFIGVGSGFGIGLAISYSRFVRGIAEPPLLMIRTIPIFALIPLFLTWFGGSNIGIVAFIAFAVFSMVIVNTAESVRNVPDVLLDYGATMGAPKLTAYRTIVVPAIVPELVGAGRVVIGVAWSVLLAGEFLAAQTGIGHVLIQARQFNNIRLMILVVALLAIYTWAMDAGFGAFARRATSWQPSTGN